MKMIKKRKWLVLVALVVILAVAYGIMTMSGGVEVDAIEADQGLVRKLIKETGTVESDNSIIISSGFTGEIAGLTGSTGDLVHSSDLLLSGEKSASQLDLKSLKAQLSAAEVSLSRARDMAGKNKVLFEQGAISKGEYDSALSMSKELEAQVLSLKYSIESYSKTSGSSGVSSPIDGTITDVFVKEGEYVTIGAPLFEIADLSKLYIKVNLIAEDADLVLPGAQVLIYPQASQIVQSARSPQSDLSLHAVQASDGPLAVSSQVRRIHLKAKEEVSGLGIVQKRVAVEIEMSPKISQRLGSDIELAIIVAEKENVLRAPKNSLFKIDGKSYIYVAGNGKAALRQVEKGLEGDDYIEIIDGLSVGEMVIQSPGNDIEDGTRIK